ncbi:hypothetical protein BC828DRAFT_380307 [Blastocladiella britannica]|nr:hypothetical protein BC828DRAFT_380307 [Blastocladiella britannica]
MTTSASSRDLGCYAAAVLLDKSASAFGTGGDMDAAGCLSLCQRQSLSLNNGNATAPPIFSFFSLQLTSQRCRCAPLVNTAAGALPAAACATATDVAAPAELYVMSVPGATKTPTVPTGAATPDSSSSSSPPSTTAGSVDGSSSTTGSASSGVALGIILAAIGAAVAVSAAGFLFIQRRRRKLAEDERVARQMLGAMHAQGSRPSAGKVPVAVSRANLAPPQPAHLDNSSSTTYVSFAPPALVPSPPSPPHQQQAPAPPATVAVGPHLVALHDLPVVPSQEILANGGAQGGIAPDPRRQYYVHQGYAPSLDDELRLAPGEGVYVLDVYDDGWAVGRATAQHRAGENEGVFPTAALVPPAYMPYPHPQAMQQQQPQHYAAYGVTGPVSSGQQSYPSNTGGSPSRPLHLPNGPPPAAAPGMAMVEMELPAATVDRRHPSADDDFAATPPPPYVAAEQLGERRSSRWGGSAVGSNVGGSGPRSAVSGTAAPMPPV